jgi:hypothetical protein
MVSSNAIRFKNLKYASSDDILAKEEFYYY